MMYEPAFDYAGSDIPAIIEHVQSQVDAQIAMLGPEPVEALKGVDRAFARGESPHHAADYAFAARVNWMPYAQEMEASQMQRPDIEAVLAGVKWFDEPSAEYLTDYEPPAVNAEAVEFAEKQRERAERGDDPSGTPTGALENPPPPGRPEDTPGGNPNG